ncbi:MAG: nuclear transport factor 2 family protein [Melioribacteraceae bacterium]|nr:nuclear transport factor 2 family protein [Melioribacteraceae bacterium]
MRKFVLVFYVIVLALVGCSNTSTSESEILQVLESQRIAWNEGNLEEYMQGYWNSDSLKFIGKNGIKYGWDSTLQNYKSSYKSKEEMGELEFKVISLEKLSDEYYSMIGQWKLVRQNDQPKGFFSLIWKKIDNGWKIISDHSS